MFKNHLNSSIYTVQRQIIKIYHYSLQITKNSEITVSDKDGYKDACNALYNYTCLLLLF